MQMHENHTTPESFQAQIRSVAVYSCQSVALSPFLLIQLLLLLLLLLQLLLFQLLLLLFLLLSVRTCNRLAIDERVHPRPQAWGREGENQRVDA